MNELLWYLVPDLQLEEIVYGQVVEHSATTINQLSYRFVQNYFKIIGFPYEVYLVYTTSDPGLILKYQRGENVI